MTDRTTPPLTIDDSRPDEDEADDIGTDPELDKDIERLIRIRRARTATT